MLLHQFPDLNWLKNQADSRFANHLGVGGIRLANSGWPSVILNTRTQQTHRPDIQGPLSIFTNLQGNSVVTVGKKRVTVTPETFFISNANQRYSLEVKEQSPTETFNIHFGEHFVETATQSITSSPDQLLENPMDSRKGVFGFYNRLIPVSPEMATIIQQIGIKGNDSVFLDEKLFQLLSILLHEQNKVNQITGNLSAIKSSTKDEILKRLIHTTDFLYTYYYQNPSLDELASVSCLSKFHFLRLFKLAYGITPHQFISQLKINRAKDLLQNTRTEIKTISHQLGFETTSTFSRLFRNQVGVYPMEFRIDSLRGKRLKYILEVLPINKKGSISRPSV